MSSAAEPSRRTARARPRNSPNRSTKSRARSCTVYGKPVHKSESTSVSADDTRSGTPLRDERAEHALDLEVDLGDEVDLPFLPDVEVAAEPGHLHRARAQDGFDGGGEKDRRKRVRHRPPAS